VYCLNGRDVDTVIVGGRVVVRSHRLQTADEEEIIREGEARGRALMRRALEKEQDLAWLWQSSHGQVP